MKTYKTRSTQARARVRAFIEEHGDHLTPCERRALYKLAESLCRIGVNAERDWAKKVIVDGFDQPTIFDEICEKSIYEVMELEI